MDGFDEQRLLGAAAAHLAVDVALEPELRPPLRALLSGLREEAELSPVGAWRASARLLTALGQRAALRRFEAETLDSHGVGECFEIDAPIFITGFARASSNLLHNLLARTPGLWAPRLWELHEPVPPPRITERWIDRRIRATEVMLEQLDDAAPDLRGQHQQDATAPGECSWLLRTSFSSLAYGLQWFVPSYLEHMAGASLEPAYRDHRRWLRVLAWRHRHDEYAGPRMLLCDPWHMGQLDALFAVYPGARVIQIAADLDEVLPTLARTCWHMQQIDGGRVRSRDTIDRYCASLLERSSQANAEARERLGPHRFIDVAHRLVLDDPIAVVREIGRRLSFPSTGQALREVERWLFARPETSASRLSQPF